MIYPSIKGGIYGIATPGIPLSDDDLVFSHFDSGPLLPNTVTHAWIKLVRRIGLKPIRLHNARHSHASLMLKQGVHPKIVQERLATQVYR